MDITHKLSLKASPEAVYTALSTESGINGWWSKDCTVGAKTGEKSLLKFNKEGNIVEMGFRTETLIPNKRVVWECTENANPAWIGTQIISEIAPAEDGTALVFSHAGFDEKWKGQDAFEMTKGGWEHFVNSLVAYCEAGVGQPW